jgi:Tfp pilus assembly protein PilW
MRGCTLVELLLGMLLGLAGAAALTALLRGGLAAWERAGLHAERASELVAAVDQMTRDLRLAGYDPASAGVAGLTVTAADQLELTADLDGDGAIDPASEERIGYRRAAGSGTLQRVVGNQTLPILSDLAAGGVRLAYFDAAGAALDPAAADTASAARLVTVELATVRRGAAPALHASGGARLVNR